MPSPNLTKVSSFGVNEITLSKARHFVRALFAPTDDAFIGGLEG